ncbi:MAG: hypothetical protein Q9163_005890 [Psora crenata]
MVRLSILGPVKSVEVVSRSSTAGSTGLRASEPVSTSSWRSFENGGANTGWTGDLQLREDVAKQIALDDWMEYQNYEIVKYEHLERSLEESPKGIDDSAGRSWRRMGSRRSKRPKYWSPKKYQAMARDSRGKEDEAERKLRMAKKRLEADYSEELGRKVQRTAGSDVF